MKIDRESIHMMGIFLAVAFVASVGRELGKDEPRSLGQIVGHVISNTILGLIAGGTLLFVTEPHPLALVAVSAAAGTLGTDTAALFIAKYLNKKTK